jgi:hypothetical protein
MTPDELRDELRALGREAAWPPTPDLAGAVAARIDARAPRAPRAPRRGWAPVARLRLAVVVAIVLAVLLAGVAVVPPARTAVLDFLGLAAREQVVRVPRLPAPAPSLQRAPDLGRRVTLARARAAVSFPVRVPALLGRPPEVRLRPQPAGGAVTLLYGNRHALTMFNGRTLRFARKSVGPRTRVIDTSVAGRPALFITGAPFRWVALDRAGVPVEATARLVDANVLLFDAGGVGYRLETGARLPEALAIARSLR